MDKSEGQSAVSVFRTPEAVGIAVTTSAPTVDTIISGVDAYALTPDQMVDLARELLVVADSHRRRVRP